MTVEPKIKFTSELNVKISIQWDWLKYGASFDAAASLKAEVKASLSTRFSSSMITNRNIRPKKPFYFKVLPVFSNGARQYNYIPT